MGRSNAQESRTSLDQLTGLILTGLGLILLVAQWSFDARDLSFVAEPANPVPRNLTGIVGAYAAYGTFFMFGLSAYLIPIGLMAVGVACWVGSLAFLRRRWPWLLVLAVALCALLRQMDGALSHMARQWVELLRVPSSGGFVGYLLYDYALWLVGSVGAVIVCVILILISLLFLSDFQLQNWLAGAWSVLKKRRAETAAAGAGPWGTARAKSKNAPDKAGSELKEPEVGPDLQPIPEPRIRDTTVSASREQAAKLAEEPKVEEQPVGSQPEIAQGAGHAAVLPVPAEPVVQQPCEPEARPGHVPARQVAEPAVGEATSGAQPVVSVPAQKPSAPARKPRKFAVAATPKIGDYQLPGTELLNAPGPVTRPAETKEELLSNARLIQQTLAQFDIEVGIGDITRGPTITRYELHPAPGVKLERISALSNNIAAALKAESVHILAPIPGKSSVGVEVPNRVKTYVYLRDLLESEEWRNTRSKIPIALGKDVYGNPIIADLADMPHLLIAGSTGSGKSVCINAIITSLLYRFAPDQLRFVMIDPKVVELQHYNALPHLVVPVITDPKKVILALRWVISEMEKRYQIFARVGVRNIHAFNERSKDKQPRRAEPELPLTVKRERIEPTADGFAVEVDEEIAMQEEEDLVIPDRLTYIVVIIDELADLMLVAPADVELAIARITQMARAAGIHCIVATQRPSVDVITGVIKANITARIAFQCASAVDSRTILDVKGAEKLIGKGDMLYLPPGSAKMIRAQGALVTDPEIERVVEFICRQAKPSYELDIHQQLQAREPDEDEPPGADEDEELIQKCIEVILSEQKASVSLLQRRLRLGYTRAARIMDELERRGIVGPSKGAEPRDILINPGAPGQPPQRQPGAQPTPPEQE